MDILNDYTNNAFLEVFQIILKKIRCKLIACLQEFIVYKIDDYLIAYIVSKSRYLLT